MVDGNRDIDMRTIPLGSCYSEYLGALGVMCQTISF